MKYSIYLAAAALLALAACGDDGSRRTTGDAGRDAGPIMLLDGGPGVDSGPVGADGGGGTCPPVRYPAPAGGVCASATLSCLMEAQSDGMITMAEFEACLAADPMPMECEACFNEEFAACATMNGCDDEAGNLECCATDSCGAMPDVACVQGMCGPEISAVQSCAMALAGTCGITMLCFM